MREKDIRRLARSSYWQFLYSRAKEMGNNIKLFNNNRDFSFIQILFMRWLEIYHILYSDLRSGVNYLDEKIIKNDLRTDAYLLYRNKDKDKNKPKKVNNTNIPTISFHSKKKRRK